MNEITSSEFRKRYATIKEVVDVTVNGHVIGRWTPGMWSGKYVELGPGVSVLPPEVPGSPLRGITTQAQRDDLLRKINRGRPL